MSSEHYKAACKIPKSVLRCGPRRLLQHICERCGSGKPFKVKSGKTITIPAGEWSITDKELMRVLGTDRRQTVYENRVTMLEACKGAVTVTYEYRTNGSWPSLVYHVDFEKLKELVPGHVAKSDTYGPQQKAIHMAADSTTESDTLLGVPTEHLTPAMNHDAGFDPSLRNRDSEWSGGENHHQNQNLILTDDDDSPHYNIPEQYREAWEDTRRLTEALIKLYPTWKVDVEDIYSLVISKKAPPEEIYEIIHWLPISDNQPLKEAASSLRFRLWFNEIQRQHQKYLQAVDDSDTHENYDSWQTIKLAHQKAASLEESLEAQLRVDPDEPVDPEDAAEEAAMWAADDRIDDGDAVDLDPMQDPFGDCRDGDIPEGDVVPESVNLGSKPKVDPEIRKLIRLRQANAFWHDESTWQACCEQSKKVEARQKGKPDPYLNTDDARQKVMMEEI